MADVELGITFQTNNDVIAPLPVPTPRQCDAPELVDEENGGMRQDGSPSPELDDTFDGYDAPAVGSSTNVLLLYHLQALRVQYWVNFLLSVACLLLVGINITLIVLNSLNAALREEMHVLFHIMEFWSTFAFSLVDVFALTFSPKPVKSIYYRPIMLKILVAMSVTISFVPAILMSIDTDLFEFACHNTEYAADMLMAIIDTILFMSLLKLPGVSLRQNMAWLALSTCSVAMGVVNLTIYNVLTDGTGERIAHFIEFFFNILNAGTMFWFCSDNRFLVEHWILSTLAPQGGLTLRAREATKRD